MKGSVKKEGSTWYYVVTLGRKNNGKPNQKKKRGFRTKKEAEKALQKLLYEYESGMYVEPSKILYVDFLEKWLKQKKTQVQTSTYMSIETNVIKHVIPALGQYQISKINASMIDDFYIRLYDEVGLSKSTVQKIHTILKESFSFAVNREYIVKNPTDSVKRPIRDTKEMEVWDFVEAKRFLEVSKDDPFYIIYHLAIATGMRQSEILGLRWKDINIKENKITIKQVMCNFTKKQKPGAKTKAGNRTILFGEETIQELFKHQEKQKQDKINAGDIYIDYDLVASTGIGTPINPSNLRRSFHRQIEKAQLKRIRFHDLRHTHATMCLILNLHPKIVQERLGHSNVKITLDTYSHVLPNMQSEASNKINEAIFR
jgi:integrase